MFGPFGPNILIFAWISTLLLFYVRAYFSLSFYLIDFTPLHTDPEVLGRCAMTFLSHTSWCSGFLRIFWITMCREKPMNESWLLNRGPLSEARPTLWVLSTLIQLKHRGLYPILFQCGVSVAESCSALNQHWVLDMNSRTFEILHFNIELAVIIRHVARNLPDWFRFSRVQIVR